MGVVVGWLIGEWLLWRKYRRLFEVLRPRIANMAAPTIAELDPGRDEAPARLEPDGGNIRE
jgi:hypothetical protein